MTNMKAALGFEPSGPIYSLIKEYGYSDIHVLHYCDARKSETTTAHSCEQIGLYAESARGDNAAEMALLQRLSNTSALCNYYSRYLQNFLNDIHDGIRLVSHYISLADLNEVEGMYHAVINIMEQISRKKEERVITFNISSGTPVMAFVWAFASLRYPHENIRLISSSKVGEIPEVVHLPEEWKKWHSKRIFPSSLENGSWDVVYHLFGEQRMPSLIGINMLPADKHVFISSKQYSAECMRDYVGESEYEEILIDAYDWKNIYQVVTAHLHGLPASSRIAFNVTGGTKIMYACALEIAKEAQVCPFYLDFYNGRLLNLHDNSSCPLNCHFDLCTLIEALNSIPLCPLDRKWSWSCTQERLDLIVHIHKNRPIVKNWEKKIRGMYPGEEKEKELFALSSFSGFTSEGMNVELKEDASCIVTIADRTFKFVSFPSIIRFLMGGWFEEFVYASCLMPLKKEGLISESRMNVELRRKDTPGESYQELDCVFTDGLHIYIGECKSGRVQGEHLTKLKTIVRNCGGLGGKGILFHTAAIKSVLIRQKADDLGILLCQIPRADKWNNKPMLNKLRDFISSP